ncbi:AMP-binding protein [Streptomyces sp. NBC_01205]|uniref:AMP-binding protein n=1 Tax=Streptomyces sp. NBC_01205 TaxID=2903771 RepID=UPI002E121573|nr:AMP-binding protein [Streptomyces sp. NBC_01205]
MPVPDPSLTDLVAAFAHPGADLALLLCDRHPADRPALRVVDAELRTTTVTYGELADRSRRLAGAMRRLGVGEGDRVATLMAKSAEHVVTLLATWRLGAVHVPLFTAFQSEAITARTAHAALVVADAGQLPKLLPPVRGGAPAPPIVVNGAPGGADGAEPAPPGTHGFRDLEAGPPLTPATRAVGGDAPFVDLYTSGTTGQPKAVTVPVRATAAFAAYQRHGLDHRPDDVFWNLADPAWGYGLYQAVIGPLALGLTTTLLRARFDPELTVRALTSLGVTNFAAAPTAYRALRNALGDSPVRTSLRACSSAGEPLPPDLAPWARRVLGADLYDHYGQSELGMAAGQAWDVASAAGAAPSEVRAFPGWTLAVLDAETGRETVGGTGLLAVDVARSPLMWFTGYAGGGGPAPKAGGSFLQEGRWFVTGDLAVLDDAGRLHVRGRQDDLIVMAGYRIGPTEIESILIEHPAVSEAGVTAAPDSLRGEVVAAYVVPAPSAATGPALVAELQALVKTRLSAHAYPRRVHFVTALPKTDSGKIRRAALHG